jgi:hypothetical protein
MLKNGKIKDRGSYSSIETIRELLKQKERRAIVD